MRKLYFLFLFVICVAGGLRAQSDMTCAELSVKELKSAWMFCGIIPPAGKRPLFG